MNIIQHGNKHKGTVVWKTSCACGWIFEFDKHDPAIQAKIYPNGDIKLQTTRAQGEYDEED